jgi:hypothetical protein
MTVNLKLSIAVVMILFCLVGAKMHVNQRFNKVNVKVKERNVLLEEVRILEAELSYLTNIDRIEKLSSQYLTLNSVADKVIILGQEQQKVLNSNVIEVKQRPRNPNWHYKSRSKIMNIRHEIR